MLYFFYKTLYYFVTCLPARQARSHCLNPPIGGLVNLHKFIVLYQVCVYLSKFMKVCKNQAESLNLFQPEASLRKIKKSCNFALKEQLKIKIKWHNPCQNYLFI